VPGGAPEQLGGYVWWFVMGVYFLGIGLSLFVAIDSVRPARRPRLDALREPWWLYTAEAVVYLAFVLAAWVPWPATLRWIAAIPVGWTLVALGFGFAYLLRVVFPKPAAEPAAPENGSDTEV